MKDFAYVTPQCCKRPAVATMDHFRGNGEPMVNRMCLHCGQHWYGNAGTAVVEFTRSAWDRWMNEPQQVAA